MSRVTIRDSDFYKRLLTKYIALVVSCEGEDLLYRCPTELGPDGNPLLSRKEVEELITLAGEARQLVY